jgi:hypothetical protein
MLCWVACHRGGHTWRAKEKYFDVKESQCCEWKNGGNKKGNYMKALT